ncbi:sensor histidine kinase [Occultella kanbiaonis]|uniref:sensor histidine kinase n=1 Tax=Occultella kanbiaonis TaxID=2675754 RepID=UPI0012B88F04|nr:histidine kinase [Occultella kanbiaonis]
MGHVRLLAETTARRAVFCVIGGLMFGAYAVLVTGFMQMLGDPSLPPVIIWILVAVAAVIALSPPVLLGVRTLEIQAVRAFLDVDVPLPVGPVSNEARWRGALWYTAHLLVGAAATMVLLSAVPVGIVLILRTSADGLVMGQLLGIFADVPWPFAIVIGVLMLAAAGAAYYLGGAVLRVLAPRLLGPSAAERIATLELEARTLAERNRLARDLHDSVGHALTITTLQAAAAARALDRDPVGGTEVARTALAAIEETGRAAVADLDRVLGLLRTDADDARERAPVPTLAGAAELVERARLTGRDVRLDLPQALDGIPLVVGREAYAVIREGLTNALRHGADPVTIAVTRPGEEVRVEITNRVTSTVPDPGGRAGGRGLAGLREGLTLVGGTLRAGPAPKEPGPDRTGTGVVTHGTWRLIAALPLTDPPLEHADD